MLSEEEKDPETAAALIEALRTDHETARVSSAERAMLDYAAKLTKTPGAMREEDVAALRAEGFDDLAIHDICAITGYYAFVNRIADGLGVELEPGMREAARGSREGP